jgi:predicted nucleic acid-binding protein
MKYLLDTNVVSETRKSSPNAGLLSFLAETDPSVLYIGVLTLGELRKGVAMKHRSDPATANGIAGWVDGLEFSFADHIVGIDATTARLWGELSAERPRPVVDTLLAATAIAHEMTFVTRNGADVNDIPRLSLLNPFARTI